MLRGVIKMERSYFLIEVPIRFQDADPAGVLFFSRAFDLFHEAFEAFMATNGFPLQDIFLKSSFLFPVVHAEGDFKKPVRPGQKVRVLIVSGKRGITSFKVEYVVQSSEGEVIAKGSTVHVAVDKATGRPIALPLKLASILSKLEKKGAS